METYICTEQLFCLCNVCILKDPIVIKKIYNINMCISDEFRRKKINKFIKKYRIQIGFLKLGPEKCPKCPITKKEYHKCLSSHKLKNCPYINSNCYRLYKESQCPHKFKDCPFYGKINLLQ